MRKSWSVVMIIVLAFLIHGVVCMGVGLLTGAEFGRIFEVADHEYHLREVFSTIRQFIQNPQSFEMFIQSLF